MLCYETIEGMHTPIVIDNIPQCQPHPWHPSVLYIAEGWNGHRYWMAQTPFPPMSIAPYRDRYELPCIHYSDDGVHWWPIDTNPISKLSEAAIDAHNYYSDPHLVLKNGILECYYRFSILQNKKLEGNKTILYKRTSKDGIHWTDQQVIADLRIEKDIEIWGEQIISQAVRWDGELYQCWYVDRSSYLTNRKIRYSQSVDGVHWTISKECTLSGRIIDPWHIDVQWYDGLYQMVVYDMVGLYWFESSDGMNYSFVSTIILPSKKWNDFYSEGLYRACSVKAKDEIYVYFSAKNMLRTSIGLLRTHDREKFEICNGMKLYCYVQEYLLPILIKKTKRLLKKQLKVIHIER